MCTLLNFTLRSGVLLFKPYSLFKVRRRRTDYRGHRLGLSMLETMLSNCGYGMSTFAKADIISSVKVGVKGFGGKQ